MDNHIEAVKGSPFLEYYYKEINDFLFTGGKRIRPILLVDSFLSIASQKKEERIIPTSLSLELLHNASLIHDDILDKADTRRGEKTFHISLRDYAKDLYKIPTARSPFSLRYPLWIHQGYQKVFGRKISKGFEHLLPRYLDKFDHQFLDLADRFDFISKEKAISQKQIRIPGKI